ncbi:hypothetical protein L1887_56499 [Cichorium endivia]|nr:hypothetical protein L1887_56499 [Cichorium endivia]
MKLLRWYFAGVFDESRKPEDLVRPELPLRLCAGVCARHFPWAHRGCARRAPDRTDPDLGFAATEAAREGGGSSSRVRHAYCASCYGSGRACAQGRFWDEVFGERRKVEQRLSAKHADIDVCVGMCVSRFGVGTIVLVARLGRIVLFV